MGLAANLVGHQPARVGIRIGRALLESDVRDLDARLQRLDAHLNAQPPHPAFAGIEHPINLNIGKIEGGDWASSVPAWPPPTTITSNSFGNNIGLPVF